MQMLKELAVFAQVVDSGGFSAAGRVLGLDTSAVSRQVSRLEAQLGARLLQRSTRSLALTELGEQVFEACKRMLSTAREIHTLAGSYSARPNGTVRVSAPVVFGQVWLAAHLPEFLSRYPEVDVRLTLIDRNVDLIDDGVDLAVRISRELAPGLVSRRLGEMRYVLVAAPGYLAQHAAPASPDELGGHQCIYLGYSAFGKQWTLQRGDTRLSVNVAARLAINNSAGILAAVEAGGGIGLVPDFTARAALAAGRVQQVLADWALCEPYAGSIHAVYMPGKNLPLKVRVLIDFLIEKGCPHPASP